MSEPTAAHFICNYCPIIEDCKNRVCDLCLKCDGEILSFPSFDVCPICYETINNEINGSYSVFHQKEYKKPLIRPTIPEEVRIAIFIRDGYRCLHCGSPDQLEIDHIIPFSKGGPSEYGNYQTLCKPCNVRKSNNL